MSYSRQIADDNPEVPATERPDRAPAGLGLEQLMTVGFSTEQTDAMRAAIEIVLGRVANHDDTFRTEVAVIVLTIAMDEDHNAETLANLTLDALGDDVPKPVYRN
jgi:hypothetical protein